MRIWYWMEGEEEEENNENFYPLSVLIYLLTKSLVSPSCFEGCSSYFLSFSLEVISQVNDLLPVIIISWPHDSSSVFNLWPNGRTGNDHKFIQNVYFFPSFFLYRGTEQFGHLLLDPSRICRKGRKFQENSKRSMNFIMPGKNIAGGGGGGGSLGRHRRKVHSFCTKEPEIILEATRGAHLATLECQFQFRNRHWNCSALPRSIRRILSSGKCPLVYIQIIHSFGPKSSVYCIRTHEISTVGKYLGKGLQNFFRIASFSHPQWKICVRRIKEWSGEKGEQVVEWIGWNI